LDLGTLQSEFVIVADEDFLEAGLMYSSYSRLSLDEVVAAILLAGDLEGTVPPKCALLDEPARDGGNEHEDLVADVEQWSVASFGAGKPLVTVVLHSFEGQSMSGVEAALLLADPRGCRHEAFFVHRVNHIKGESGVVAVHEVEGAVSCSRVLDTVVAQGQ
jgi:hypothetical protein